VLRRPLESTLFGFFGLIVAIAVVIAGFLWLT
jgi:hypothetical protein